MVPSDNDTYPTVEKCLGMSKEKLGLFEFKNMVGGEVDLHY